MQLPVKDRRALAAARAATICFLVQGTLVLTAAVAVGDFDVPVLAAVGASVSLAIMLICLYERLPRLANHLLALVATLIVAELTFFQPSGERYAPLYLGVAIFVSFYFNQRQVIVQLLAVVSLWALALAQAYPAAEAAQIWVLGAGTLITAAATMRSVRDRLSRTAEHAKSQRVAAKSAPDAKPAQRKGRSAGAEESHQKAKSKGA